MTRTEMTARSHPMAYAAVGGLEAYCRRTMDAQLKELVVLRASVLNDCRYCQAMHRRDALKRGETPERLDAVAAWQDHHDLFDDREKVAFELTDAVTLIHGEKSVPDALWTRVVETFGGDGAGHLLMTIATINVWNRLAITLRQDPATLKP